MNHVFFDYTAAPCNETNSLEVCGSFSNCMEGFCQCEPEFYSRSGSQNDCGNLV